MAWPPPVLPVNRTNATPQLDTHAADHNALAQASNDTVAAVQRHENHTLYGVTFGAGGAANPPGGAGPIRLPTKGLWFVSTSVDLQPSASGWGYVDIWYSTVADQNRIGATIHSGMVFETPPTLTRTNGVYIAVIDATIDNYDVYVRLGTYTGGVHYNGISVAAWRLYSK